MVWAWAPECLKHGDLLALKWLAALSAGVEAKKGSKQGGGSAFVQGFAGAEVDLGKRLFFKGGINLTEERDTGLGLLAPNWGIGIAFGVKTDLSPAP